MVREIDSLGLYAGRSGSLEAIKHKVNFSQYQKTVDPNAPSALEKKVAELRKDPKFSKFNDSELYDYALSCLKNYSTQINAINNEAVFNKLGQPLDPQWSQFTYEEILEMEDNGVKIPEEFLEWAHSMQSENTVEYELDTGDVIEDNDADGLRADIGDAGNMGLKNVAKVFAKQTKTQEDQINQAITEFEPLSANLDSVKSEADSVQNNTMKKIQNMMSEWQVLDTKAKRGEALSEDEKARYAQLGLTMNNEVKSSVVQIENLTVDFDKIAKEMTATSKLAKVAQDYATDTSYIGGLIANYEAKHKSASTGKNQFIFDGTVGVVDLLKSNAVGRNLAMTSITSGNKLKTVSFDADKSIKTITNQMSTISTNTSRGNSNVSTVVDEGIAKADSVAPSDKQETKEPDAKEKDTAILPEDELMVPPEIAEMLPANGEDGDDNTLAEEENPNSINTILKKNIKGPSKPQPTETIVV